MHILSFDPGQTTGVCEIRILKVPYDIESSCTIDTWQIGPEDHHGDLFKICQASLCDHIVAENFIHQRRGSAVLKPVEYLGVIKLFCSERKDVSLTIQTPAMAKNFWTDEKIKSLGLWKRSSPHAMDALRHGLYFVTTTLKNNRFIREIENRRVSPPLEGVHKEKAGPQSRELS